MCAEILSPVRASALALLLASSWGIPAPGWAQDRVDVEQGNVVFSRGDERVQLTDEGLDVEAVLSPDGRWIAFVRSTPGVQVWTGAGPAEAREIWLADADELSPKRAVVGRGAESMRDTLAALTDLRFSPDGRFLFFLSGAWATSGAVHRIELPGGAERFVCPGGPYAVLDAGRFAGNLLVWKHKYRRGGGSYDKAFIVTFEGEEVSAAPDALVERVWPPPRAP